MISAGVLASVSGERAAWISGDGFCAGSGTLCGVATVASRREGDLLILTGLAEGARARLKPEALVGLSGQRLTEGLAGQWVQPYWLWLNVKEAGGQLVVVAEEGRVAIEARFRQ